MTALRHSSNSLFSATCFKRVEFTSAWQPTRKHARPGGLRRSAVKLSFHPRRPRALGINEGAGCAFDPDAHASRLTISTRAEPCCRKYLLLAEVRKHSGRTTFRLPINRCGSQLVSTLGRATRAAPLRNCNQSDGTCPERRHLTMLSRQAAPRPTP